MVVYDLVVAKSREVGNESVSFEEFLGCDDMVVENIKGPVLNDDPIGDIDVEDSDEFETILWFKRTVKTVPQMSKPTELTTTHHRKQTTLPNVLLTVPMPRP